MNNRLMSLRTLGLTAALAACGCASVAQPSGASVGARASVSSRAESTGDVAQFLQPFPAAKTGQTRWVIALPARADEDQVQVELLPTIRMRTDCNHHMVSAKVEEHSVDGWGYGYDVMGEIGPVVSTMMACPPEETRERDVPVQTGLTLRRYRSGVPMVFYTPEAVTLRYRFWRVDSEAQTAKRQVP